MEKMTKEEWFQLISIAVTILLSVFKNDMNSKVVIPIIIMLIIIILFNLVYNKTKANKNLSNTAVITKSRKYTKFLSKLIKENVKVLKKFANVKGFRKLEKTNKQILKKISGKYKGTNLEILELKKQLAAELDKYYSKDNRDYVSNETIKVHKSIGKLVKYANKDEAYEIYKIVHKNIKDLRRILLQLEQHTLRIKLGKYVVKYSLSIEDQITSYIDDIGWTHVLLGDNKKGTDVIKMAINLIDYKISNVKVEHLSEDEKSDYYKYLLLKARALRHLGTTYYTYKSAGLKVGEYLREALDIVCDKEFEEYHLTTTTENKKNYYAMRQGIEYNMMLFKYYEHLKNRDLSDQEFKNLYIQADNMILELNELEKEGLSDKHRLIKLLTFKNQIYKEIKDEKFINQYADTIEQDLKSIEKVLNRNVYFDEALEVYLCQKVEKVYDDVDLVFDKRK